MKDTGIKTYEMEKEHIGYVQGKINRETLYAKKKKKIKKKEMGYFFIKMIKVMMAYRKLKKEMEKV